MRLVKVKKEEKGEEETKVMLGLYEEKQCFVHHSWSTWWAVGA